MPGKHFKCTILILLFKEEQWSINHIHLSITDSFSSQSPPLITQINRHFLIYSLFSLSLYLSLSLSAEGDPWAETCPPFGQIQYKCWPFGLDVKCTKWVVLSFWPSRSDRLMIEASHPRPPIKRIVTRDEALVAEYNAGLCFGVPYYLVSEGWRKEGSYRKKEQMPQCSLTHKHTHYFGL